MFTTLIFYVNMYFLQRPFQICSYCRDRFRYVHILTYLSIKYIFNIFMQDFCMFTTFNFDVNMQFLQRLVQICAYFILFYFIFDFSLLLPLKMYRHMSSSIIISIFSMDFIINFPQPIHFHPSARLNPAIPKRLSLWKVYY